MHDSQACSFPEYGSGGDTAGARRVRHSFRLCAFACIVLTIMLWFSERYLRYELVESQYIAALTLEPESARAMLRQVVKRDASLRESPTPKYLAALAEREEADLVLPTYERACKADPNNPFTAMQYGCRLFTAERFADAFAQFQRAALLPPNNAWPAYLQAATLPFLKPEAEVDLGESLALLAKANSSGAPLILPRPLWTAAMPEQGFWYEKQRRRISDEFCAPLYRYVDLVTRQARRAAATRQAPYMDSWLETLQRMGERLTDGADLLGEQGAAGGGSIQATAGIHIQIMALDERLSRHPLEGAASNAPLNQLRSRLSEALAQLNAFEDTRDRHVENDRRRYTLPLHLCWQTVGVLFLAYLFSYGLSWLMRVRRHSWTLPHSRLGINTFIVGQSALLLLLTAMALLQHYSSVTLPFLSGLRVIWWTLVALLLVFGMAYPHVRLPRYAVVAARCRESALRQREEDDRFRAESGLPAESDAPPLEPESSTQRAARGARRVAYVALLRRYYGVVMGLFFCTISLWTIGYRVVTSLYPWQLEVLVTGLGREEAGVVHRVIAFLAGSGA